MKTKAFTIDEELLEKLQEQADKENRNFSNMIRECIRSYVDE